MKVAALAALSVLIALPAEAGQAHRRNDSPLATCDNDGHCTTFATAARASSPRKNWPKVRSAVAAANPPATANGAVNNETAVAVATAIVTDSPASIPLPTPRPQAAAFDAHGNTAGVIISSKTGARARVGVAYAARFQAYIDDLENNHGARILFMGGIRPGRCSVASEHPCGKALDVCQLRRGAVDPRCNLPGRAALGQIAAAHGLFEGGRWCDSDYGHAQIGVTAPACGGRWPVRLVQTGMANGAVDLNR